jgi:hypothetical protein
VRIVFVGFAILAFLVASCGGGTERTSAVTPTSAATASVGCSATEQLTYHIHAHLALFVDGAPETIPAGIGIHRTCIAWLHTHDTSGIIHVEAPAPHTYTVGDFFAVWGKRLDTTHLLDHTAGDQHHIEAYVDGNRYDGPPQTIPLTPHAVIVIEYGPPFVPPPPFTFPSGF